MSQALLNRVYERVLVLRCQAGDAAAFEELIERYDPRLRRFLRKMLGDERAQDALQDVWLDVWRGLSHLNDAAALEAWLFRIARDRCYRVLRRRGFAAMQPIDEQGPAEEIREGLEPDERAILASSLDTLAHEHREVLLLRFVEQLSYEQIAQCVGCELGTVRSRLHYAKKQMRNLLMQRK